MKIAPLQAPAVLSAASPVVATRSQVVLASFNLWAVGITVVIGGQYFSWNAGLSAGTVSYGIASIMMGFAYLSLCMSMAEVSSMVPFEGGAFGLARCTWGFYAGFIVGCCEAVQYILYVTCAFVALGRMVAQFWPLIADHQYISWGISYVLSSGMLIVGGNVYWRWNMALALLSFSILIVYVCGSLPYVDIATHGGGTALHFVGGFNHFMAVFPLTAWYYVGVESLNRLCAEVVEPRRSIPMGQMACMYTLFATSIMVFFVTISVDPGMPSVATSLAIMNPVFNKLFNCTDDISTLLALPATFATGQGFVQAYMKIISCMAGSKLIPVVLHEKHPKWHTPVYAIVVASCVSFGLCFVDFYASLDTTVFNTCIFLGCISYLSQCVGYLYLKKNFRSMERKYKSPFGRAGAIYASAVWLWTMVSIANYQGDGHTSVLIAVGVLGVCTVYYYAVAKERQTISEEERKALFFAHVSKHNLSKRRTRTLRQKAKSWIHSKATFVFKRMPQIKSSSSNTSCVHSPTAKVKSPNLKDLNRTASVRNATPASPINQVVGSPSLFALQ
ncbi:hypothetical protein H310_06341 [Aphanomyces invadans]|uniref:Amino acid permease/ SLC12A domain-containing protein n=1 Tax=Aphanomyces invadans TaxID=157072 RepID=A0A024U5P2_9STRA|nr:hypothetical protein H310_06341 [Aphanomyces invadans]ETW01736.1 hypothetical protein H310_06341 [Aphanomyces invadans]|eukprot:XP_008869584.1 hypothetical protein H310_06341 [Aphanomyces invadans]